MIRGDTLVVQGPGQTLYYLRVGPVRDRPGRASRLGDGRLISQPTLRDDAYPNPLKRCSCR